MDTKQNLESLHERPYFKSGAGDPKHKLRGMLEGEVKLDQICLLDMDGTVADYVGSLTRSMLSLASENDPEFDLSDDQPPHILKRMKLIKNSKDWWLRLPILQDGFELVEAATQVGFKMHVLTKGPANTTTAWTQKVQWCNKYLPDIDDITITRDKGLVYGKILIDDYPDYMDRWLANRPRGLGIMPLRSYNKDYSHPNVIHYDGRNILEVKEKMQEQFNR